MKNICIWTFCKLHLHCIRSVWSMVLKTTVPQQTGRGVLVSAFCVTLSGGDESEKWRIWAAIQRIKGLIQRLGEKTAAIEFSSATLELLRETVTYAPLWLSKADKFTFGTKAVAVTIGIFGSSTIRATGYNVAVSERLSGSIVITCCFTFSLRWSKSCTVDIPN